MINPEIVRDFTSLAEVIEVGIMAIACLFVALVVIPSIVSKWRRTK